eukprot:3348996-Prymnesium_polylepis.1
MPNMRIHSLRDDGVLRFAAFIPRIRPPQREREDAAAGSCSRFVDAACTVTFSDATPIVTASASDCSPPSCRGRFTPAVPPLNGEGNGEGSLSVARSSSSPSHGSASSSSSPTTGKELPSPLPG